MKALLLLAASVGALALTAPAATAAPWQSINQRQSMLDHRIDAGVRNRSLTQDEAYRLRAQFNDLARLEARYRSNGLTAWERSDLDRRFDALSVKIRYERHDDDRWTPINERQRDLDARIDAGLRDRSLSRSEADRLRAEFRAITRLEASYRRNGLSSNERAALDQRMDRLSTRIFAERRDRNNYYG